MSKFVDGFRKLVNKLDPMPNSKMTEDTVLIKTLAPWCRKACNDIVELEAELKATKEEVSSSLQITIDSNQHLRTENDNLEAAYKHAIEGFEDIKKSFSHSDFSNEFAETIKEISKHIAECETLKEGK